MPPEQVNVSTSIQPESTKSIFSKRKVVWTAILLLILASPVLWFYGFFDYAKAEVINGPKLLNKTYLCPNSSISWKVQETIHVQPASFSIDNPHGPHVYTVSELLLRSKQGNIARLASGGPGGPYQDIYQAHQNIFSTGEAFTHAYIFTPDVISNSNLYLGIEVPSSKINQEDFDTAVKCFRLEVTDATYKRAVGWMMRVDDSIARDSYLQAPEFTCSDGRHARTSEYFLDFLPVGEMWETTNIYDGRIGMIGFDGKLYKIQGNVWLDTSYGQVALPNVECTNNKGIALQDFLVSIPNRITVLDN